MLTLFILDEPVLWFIIFSQLKVCSTFCFIIDPIKTAQGSLSLKAYRLTPKLMEICKEKDFSPEGSVKHTHTHRQIST